MRLRWTTTALDDFVRVVERNRADNPEAALRVARTIYEAINLLRTFPNRRRVGRAKDTRELVFPPWPYIVVYEIVGEQVLVLRVRHASQDWP
jgi:addiction module RelE/StbE family toxin